MPDLPIVIPDTAAAPKDYTLSGTQELQLKTVRALIDGSAAASAFLPTLQLLDPNGHVMWEGATSSTVAAGGSADVSWFPGLGQQSSGSSSSVAMVWAEHGSSVFANIGAGATTVLGMGNSLDYTNTPSVFTLATDGSARHGIGVSASGHYLFKAQLIIKNVADNTGVISSQFVNAPSGPSFSSYGSEDRRDTAATLKTFSTDGDGWYMEALVTVNGGPFPVGPFLWQVANGSAGTLQAFVNILAIQMDTDTTDIP